MSSLKEKYLTDEEENLGKGTYAMLAGGGSSGATQITKKHFVIGTCATANDSGMFTQAALPGAEYFGEHNGAANAKIFPKSGDKFEDQAVDAAYLMEPGAFLHFKCVTAGKWRVK